MGSSCFICYFEQYLGFFSSQPEGSGGTESGGQIGGEADGEHTRRRVSRAAPPLPGGRIQGSYRVGILCRRCQEMGSKWGHEMGSVLAF